MLSCFTLQCVAIQQKTCTQLDYFCSCCDPFAMILILHFGEDFCFTLQSTN